MVGDDMGRPKKDRVSKVPPRRAQWQLETVEKHRLREAGYGRQKYFISLYGTDPDAIQKAVASAYNWSILPPVENDEQVAERLNYFFQHSAETGDLPTMEKLALALGVDVWTVSGWANGSHPCSAERREMILKARTIMSALDAELASTQKINPVTYIFRAKNYYGMRDQHESIVTTITQEAKAPERLLADYDDIVDVDYEEKSK